MSHMRPSVIAVTASIVALAVSATTIAGGNPYAVVFAPGASAPGFDDGTTFTFLDLPAINNAGQFAVEAHLEGGSVEFTDNIVIYKGLFTSPGGASIVAREGDLAPGAPDMEVFNFFDNVNIADTGRIVFLGDRRPAGSSSDGGIWTIEPNGDITDILLEGEQAVGAEIGEEYRSVIFSSPIGGDGTVIPVARAGFSNDGLWYGAPSMATQKVAIENEPAPLMGEDVLYGNLIRPRAINGNGLLAVESFLQGDNVDPETQNIIWMGTPAGLTPAVREGDQAVGRPMGTVINFPELGGVNDAGTVVYTASTRTEIQSRGVFDNYGLWTTNGAETDLIAYSGDEPSVLNEGESILFPRFPEINAVGDIIFTTTIEGEGVEFEVNDAALMIASPGAARGEIDYAIAMRAGDPAPELDGVFIFAGSGKFGGRFDYSFNGVGQAAILTSLTGEGVDSTNDEAIYLYDPDLGLQLVAREGDPLAGDMRGDDAPTITDLRMHDGTGGQDGGARALNDLGQFVFRVELSDGSWLFASAVIPAPSGAMALSIGALAFARRRRR